VDVDAVLGGLYERIAPRLTEKQRVGEVEQGVGAAGQAGVRLGPERAEPHEEGSWDGIFRNLRAALIRRRRAVRLATPTADRQW